MHLDEAPQRVHTEAARADSGPRPPQPASAFDATQPPLASGSPQRRFSSAWTALGLIVAALILIGAYVLWLQAARSFAESGNAGLTVPEELLNFGEVWEEKDFQWRLRVVNRTRHDIDVSDLQWSCRCTSVEPRSFVVPARGYVDLHLILDFTPPGTDEGREEWSDFVTSVVPVVKTAPPKQAGWEIRGRVRHPFFRSSTKLQFGGGDRVVRGAASKTKSVLLTAYSPFDRVLAQYDATLATVFVRRSEHDPLQFELLVRPEPDMPEGSFQFDILLRGVPPGGQVLPPVAVGVAGTVCPDVQISPSVIHFGARSLGENVSGSVTLYSVTGVPFAVEAQCPDTTGLEVRPLTSPRASRHTFEIAKRVTQIGHDLMKIRFAVQSELGEQYTVTLPMSVYGLAGEKAAK